MSKFSRLFSCCVTLALTTKSEQSERLFHPVPAETAKAEAKSESSRRGADGRRMVTDTLL